MTVINVLMIIPDKALLCSLRTVYKYLGLSGTNNKVGSDTITRPPYKLNK